MVQMYMVMYYIYDSLYSKYIWDFFYAYVYERVLEDVITRMTRTQESSSHYMTVQAYTAGVFLVKVTPFF